MDAAIALALGLMAATLESPRSTETVLSPPADLRDAVAASPEPTARDARPPNAAAAPRGMPPSLPGRSAPAGRRTDRREAALVAGNCGLPVEEVLAMRAAGLSWQEIAHAAGPRLGVPRATVSRHKD